MNKWIAVFRTGTHTDSKGKTRTWTEDDLDHTVESYDANNGAPIVIGHPKTDSPAWGWVEDLKREGKVLYAKTKDLVPEFKAMLGKKMFKNRSISLNADGSLRHIGFLGATPPAVKGLEDIAFSEDEEIRIEFKELTPLNPPLSKRGSNGDKSKQKEGRKIMNFFEWLRSKAADDGVTLDNVPTTFSTQQDVQRQIDDAVKAREAELTQSFSEKEAELKKEKDALDKQAADSRKKTISDFCEGLKEKGTLTPAMEKLGMGITEFMQQISTIETTIDFAEGDGKQTPLEFMQSFLGSLPKSIEFGEFAGKGKDAGGGNPGEKLEALTQQKLKDNKEFNYASAFAEVQKEFPELAAEYAEELKGGQ